jgi:hypothetical protein
VNNRELEQVLEYLQTSFPPHLTEQEVVVWSETIKPLEMATAVEVIRTYRSEQTFKPAFHDFLSEAQRVDDRKAAARQAEREGTLPVPGSTRLCPECGEGRGWVTVTEGYVATQQVKMMSATGLEASQLRAALGNTVKPCSRCRPVLHALHRDGHCETDHSCPDCETLRAGGPSAKRLTKTLNYAAGGRAQEAF